MRGISQSMHKLCFLSSLCQSSSSQSFLQLLCSHLVNGFKLYTSDQVLRWRWLLLCLILGWGIGRNHYQGLRFINKVFFIFYSIVEGAYLSIRVMPISCLISIDVGAHIGSSNGRNKATIRALCKLLSGCISGRFDGTDIVGTSSGETINRRASW